ncbi:ABC transporter ATP-binding protein [Blastococcus sp. PRF04-17]|uniref:ABC transporter ATP-binding protein n=1 Tax=Blastococcus sp. PRF04-17 TaxID=2933797 RepID=UPI001FF6883F|nr:ABC transporter ATP-binding protein [Blastococcus sp. PRF04-17]UOX99836.1 ABC transporter ATP-binding protein/permease [Blastococcus sp. PRF04-17]
MSDDPGQDWRGVASEDRDELSAGAGIYLRDRSRRLLGELIAPHRRSLWGLLLTITVQNLAWLAGPFLIGVGIDVAVPALVDGDVRPLVWITVAMLGAAVLDTVLRFVFLTWSGRVGQAVLLTLRRRVFRHVQRLPLAFHERYTSGKTISRLTSDIEALAELLDEGLDNLVTAMFSVVTIGVVLVVLDPPLGVVALLGFPVLFWVARWFQRNSTKAYRRTRETVAALIVQFTETFGGIRAVQAFRREPRNDELHAVLNEDNRRAHDRAFWLIAVFVPAVTLIGNLVTVAVLTYGALRVMDGDLAVGVLVSFLLYLRRFFDPLQDVAMFYNSYQSATAALEKLSGVLEERPTVAEPSDPVPLPAARGEVVLDGVRFGYTDRTVLPHLDVTIPAGQTVALVGATGAGKSTLARLAARFYDPQDGAVRLDGVPLDRLADEDLRRAVVMVTQESFLFSGSIADNIAFGRPGATREEIEASARAIGADDFITALPEGYDTDVSKRGGRLSAGQRQLVSFARAFLADPAVLILDEATSSLDVPSERLVQRALRTLLADRTALIIAHRLSTVEIADRVLVMDDGRIVEDGSPSDLIRGIGRFADLHRAWADSLV